MYQTVITLKDTVPENMLANLRLFGEKAFNNRAGKAISKCDGKRKLIFEGGEELYGCLHLGMFDLYDNKDFLSFVGSWEWIDEEEPSETCDVLIEFNLEN